MVSEDTDMSIAFCPIAGAAIASPIDSSTGKRKPTPKRQYLAKPDLALLPEPR